MYDCSTTYLAGCAAALLALAVTIPAKQASSQCVDNHVDTQAVSYEVCDLAGISSECCTSGCDCCAFWRPYLDLEGRAGDVAEAGQGNVMLPLFQNSEELLFADIRGWAGDREREGNAGIAYRRILDGCWIAGVYGFYDYRESRFDNEFQQFAFGAELLSVKWDFRVNGYIPDRQVRVGGIPGTNLILSERAYYGVDAEIGALIYSFGCNSCSDCGIGGRLSDLDAEIRAYIGAFHFDNDTTGFDNISGPRARVELRMFDLPLLGPQSRLVLSGQVEHDDERGTRGQGMITVRIPFGPGRDAPRLGGLARRMVTPIVRDVDIVTNVQFTSIPDPPPPSPPPPPPEEEEEEEEEEEDEEEEPN